jgi:hypothetical protein
VTTDSFATPRSEIREAQTIRNRALKQGFLSEVVIIHANKVHAFSPVTGAFTAIESMVPCPKKL